MPEELEYIDEICRKSLADFKPSISPTHNFCKQFPKSVSQSSDNFNRLLSIKTGLIAIGGAGIISSLIIFNNKPNRNTEKQQPIIERDSLEFIKKNQATDTISMAKDSCNIVSDSLTQEVKTRNIKNDVVHKKVVVKKNIKLKRQIIITDTIRINDTLRSH
jgi:hypothetical protein